MAVAAQSQSTSTFHDIGKGIQSGGVIMLAQSPFVTGFNRVSVVCCLYDLSMQKSTQQIFQGTIDSMPKPSIRHFFKGVSGHLVKESLRVWFKASGLVLKPQMDHFFGNTPSGKFKSDLGFAGGLSVAEMLINPADTVRTMLQANKRVRQVEKGKLLSHLYKGASANGTRQFGTWLGFSISERVWSKVVEETTPLNPHTLSGIFAKALPQSLQITAPVWLFERLKNELQYRPNLCETMKSRYRSAFKQIVNEQGWRGFWRGFMPKVWSNAVLVVGADYLLEQGRKAQKAKMS